MRNPWPHVLIAAAVLLSLASEPAVAADPALRLLLKKGIITQEEHDQALQETGQAEAAPPAKAKAAVPVTDDPKGVTFGYDRGLYAQAGDRFRLKIGIRLQARFTDSRFNAAYNTVGDAKNYPGVSAAGVISATKHAEDLAFFSMHSARLVFEGFAFSPNSQYFVQFRNDTNSSTRQPGATRSTTQLYDAYLTLTQIPWANLRVGQYRTHFGRQEFTPEMQLQFVDRGFVSGAFVPSGLDRRDQGITMFSDQATYPINYAVGVFNGVGINLNRLGLSTPGNANELMYVGRITADVLGKPGYAEGDLVASPTPHLAVGVSYGYNGGLQTNTTGAGSNNQISTALASRGNGRLLNQGIVDIGTGGLDAIVKYKGFSLQAEGFVRNIDTHDHSRRIGNATGYYAQGGYFVLPGQLEVVGRWSAMDPDTRAAQDLLTSGVGGLNWYVNGHEHKMQLDYGVITTRLSAADAGGAVSLRENRFRLQYTIAF